MRVAIIGSGGLVGKEFTHHFSNGHEVLPLTHNDLNVTDAQAVKHLVLDERPALIINCSVIGVDACELNPESAWAVNAVGAGNLAEAAVAIDADILQLSTNYVFDGQGASKSFYTLEDVPNPINVYGQTKLAGERAVTTASRRCFIVRTSWVFGAGKENFFSAVHRNLDAGNKISAIKDVWASSTYARDLVLRSIEILKLRRYGTYHVVNSDHCSYHDFALEAGRILKIADTELARLIEPVNLCALQLTAKRPRYTPMRCIVSEEIGLAPLRDWRSALAEYIHDDDWQLNQ